MCGLNGHRTCDDASADAVALFRMRVALHAPGPDDAGLWCASLGGLGPAHRRLAILDLSTRGAQPMASAGGRYHVAFKGEIYNHLELRAWCEACGARYVNESKILLHVYALRAANFLRHLYGIFAFALSGTHACSLLQQELLFRQRM